MPCDRGSDFNRDSGADKQEAAVQIQTLTGPTVESHPWHEMLKGQKPKNRFPMSRATRKHGKARRLYT